VANLAVTAKIDSIGFAAIDVGNTEPSNIERFSTS
jgi:predicted dinucleotide-binding enzyme